MVAERSSEVKREKLPCYLMELNRKQMKLKRNSNFIVEFEFLFQLLEIKFNFLTETQKNGYYLKYIVAGSEMILWRNG